jgi:hypothetical protein
MRDHILVATPVRGPLTADQLTAVLESFRSVHQFQPFDQFSVVYISESLSLQLDRGPMESIVEFLENGNASCRRTQFLRSLLDKISIRPKPEPEVAAAMERVTEPELEPEAVSHFNLAEPKYIARVRYHLKNGRRLESTHAIDSLRELDYVLERGPFDDDIRKITVKLVIQ